jgi:hypothetical protein
MWLALCGTLRSSTDEEHPVQKQTVPAAKQPQEFMVRISPKRPATAPSRLGLPWLEGIGRRFYDADLGFVAVPKVVAELLRRVHANGNLTECDGEGPLLFDVLLPEQAQKIVKIEQQRALLEAAGGNSALRGALAGAYTDEDFGNLGINRSGAPSAADVARQAQADAEGEARAASPAAPASPESASSATTPQPRVGRRPPRGKAPLPGSSQ